MKHHTKTLGDEGVLRAKLDLLKRGYVTCSPDTEHAPFDLIAWKDGRSVTIQVKARNVTSRGCVGVSFKSYWADKHGSHMVEVDKNAIDLYCVYCPQTELCYYFDPKKYNKGISIRVEESKNSQKLGINWHEDFLEVPL